MSMEPCVKVKEEPRSSFAIDVCIKEEIEWGEGAEEEPAVELGCLPSDQAATLQDRVKAEPSGYEIASSGNFSEAAMLAGLYNDPVVKDELVLGPERVQKPHVAAVSRERNPRESSAVSVRPPAVDQPVVRQCSVRLERVAAVLPVPSVPPSPGPSVPAYPAPGPRRSRRPRAPVRAASPAARSERAVHTTVVYKSQKDQICHLCGRRYVLKWNLKRHVKVHIHRGPWICTRTQEESVPDSDEEVDVVSLDPPGPLLAATLLRTNMNYLPCDSDTDYQPEGHKSDRLRRSSLRKLFNELRKQIPVTRSNERMAKIAILREAISLCRRLRKEMDFKEEELESLIKQQNKLLAKLKGVSLAVIAHQMPQASWHGSRYLKLYKSRLQNACPRRKRKMCHVEVVLQKTRVLEA